MFILPPPPRYPVYSTSTLGAGVKVDNAIELASKLTQHAKTSLPATGTNFAAPEGVYEGRDCLCLSDPGYHPSDMPPAVVNPLAPVTFLPRTHSSGVRLTVLKTPSSSAGQRSLSNTSTVVAPTTSRPWYAGPRRPSVAATEHTIAVGTGGVSAAGDAPNHQDAFEAALGPFFDNNNNNTDLDGKKRKAPKTSLTKNNSSFISRTLVIDNLNKKLNERQHRSSVNSGTRGSGGGEEECLMWANMGRSFNWFDPANNANLVHNSTNGTGSIKKELLSKILFTKSHPLCHDINLTTYQANAGSNGSSSLPPLDLVLGMSSGDIVYLEAMSNKYTRINKNGDVTRSAITDIKWLPGSPNYFVTTHANGMVMVFDKDREDGGFAQQGGMALKDARSTEMMRVIKSLYSSPSPSTNGNGSTNGTSNNNNNSSTNTSNNNNNNNNNNNLNDSRYNPVAVYHISNLPLTSITFSPNRRLAVLTSNDGYLRVLDLATEKLTDVFPSYYAGILAAAFSPDGRYLVTAGQDDMITIFSLLDPFDDEGTKERRVVARGINGHGSWVRRVAFDPWNCDDLSYRIGSVAEDGTLSLWDFSPLQKIKKKTAAAITTGLARAGSAVGDEPAPQPSPRRSTAATPSDQQQQQQQPRVHPFVPLEDVTQILPVAVVPVKPVNDEAGKFDYAEALSDLVFLRDRIVVAAKDGRVWTWLRPVSDAH